MRRRIFQALLVAAAVLAFLGQAWAGEVVDSQLEALHPEQLEELTGQVMDQKLDTSIDLMAGLKELGGRVVEELTGDLTAALRTGALLMVAVILCGVVDSVQVSSHLKGMDLTSYAGTAAVLALGVTDIQSLMSLGRSAMEEMANFSKALLPTMSAALAASGSITGASVRQVATMFFSDILLTLIQSLLMPMVYLYIALCAGYAAVGNQGLKSAAGLLKWVTTVALTGIVTVFVAYLGAVSAIAGTADAMTARAANLAISSLVPVVGGILSNATETVVAGAGLLKNAVGVFGMLAVLAFCLTPFLQLGVHYLVYKITAALSGTVSQGRVAGLIGDMGSAFGLVLGMTGACGLILLVSLISGISVSVT